MGMLVTRDDEEGELDELVSMIDRLMEQGSGHLTIDIDENENGIKVNRYSTTECGVKPGACEQPTELADDED